MNKCKWNIGLLEGKVIYCNKEIKKGYKYCYGHEMQDRTKVKEYKHERI